MEDFDLEWIDVAPDLTLSREVWYEELLQFVSTLRARMDLEYLKTHEPELLGSIMKAADFLERNDAMTLSELRETMQILQTFVDIGEKLQRLNVRKTNRLWGRLKAKLKKRGG